jgi:Tol biopolymer transport system component
MTEEKWRKALDLYLAAADLPPEQRESFLDSCSIDPELIQKVIGALEETGAGSSINSAVPCPGSNSGTSRIGTRVGHYIVTAALGRGGMGEVFSAQDTDLGRTVALKFLLPDGFDSNSTVERFILEAKAASSLNHPNIVTVHEVIRSESSPAIVMELIEGTSIRELCGNPQPVDQVIRLGQEIAEALSAAHVHGIVHRDVKPENIMVRGDGHVKVLDFGLARQISVETARSGLPAGTLRYMSPEQIRGETLTGASDVFSLGLTLYELLTGRHPFQAVSAFDTAMAIAHQEPQAPSQLNGFVPPRLEALVLRMLARNAGARPSAAEVARGLTGIQREPASAPAGARPKLKYPRSQGNRRTSMVVVAGLILLAAGSVWYARERSSGPPELVLRQITATPSENRVTTAAISGDGEKLAYAVFDGTLFIRRSAGNAQTVPVQPDFRIDRIAWWADGSQLLVSGYGITTRRPSLWIVPLNGAVPYLLRDDARHGSPSPDGTKVAFSQNDRSEIWTMELTSQLARKVVAGRSIDTFPVVLWSPDSKHIIYQRRRYVPRQDPRVGDERSDIEKDYERSYESVNFETGRMVASARKISITSACALPDGRMLFLSPHSSQALTYAVWEAQMSPDGKLIGDPEQITSQKETWLSDISASQDGKHILIVRAQREEGGIRIGELKAPGPQLTNIRSLTTQGQDYPHGWTADSRAVIFESRRNGTFDLFKQEPGQYDAQTLRVSDGDEVVPQLSPDGKWVLYAFAAKDGYYQGRKLMRVSVDGGQPLPVPIGAGMLDEFRCALSAGKRCVLRTTENGQHIFHELDPITGIGPELYRAAWTPTLVGDWALSPNGSEIAIPNYENRERRIHIIALDPPVSGPNQRDLIVDGPGRLNGVNWAADGRGLYVILMIDEDLSRPLQDASVRLMYVDSNAHTRVLHEASFNTWAVPSPDGRYLAFPETRLFRDAWMFDRH